MTTQNPAIPALPGRSVLSAFFLFMLVGGGTSVAIRMTYAELAPFWAEAARFGLAALAFWALVFFRQLPVPRGRALLKVDYA